MTAGCRTTSGGRTSGGTTTWRRTRSPPRSNESFGTPCHRHRRGERHRPGRGHPARRAGAHVVVCGIDAEGAQRAAERIGGEARVLDLSRTADPVGAEFDVGILVNNARIQHVPPPERFDPERVRIHAAADAGGAVPVEDPRPAGKRLQVRAKHGLLGLPKVIALEGATKGVTSNCVCPGYVRTPLVENHPAGQAEVHGLSTDEVVSEVLLARSAVKRLIEPGEVAGAVAYLCPPEAPAVTGTELVLDGGWSPAWL